MASKKPIDRQFLLDSLKNFDQEILSKKYSNNSPEEKVTKEMVESLLLSEAALSETFEAGDTVPIVNTDESGHRSVAKLTTIDSLAAEVAGKIDIPEIPDSSIDICPLIIAQLFLPDSINSDVGGTCSISKNQTVGVVPKIDQQGIALIHQHNHLYHNRFKVTGSFDDTNSTTIQFISNKIQIDTDLAPGILLYGSVADEIQKNQSTMVTENFFIGPLPKVNDAGYGLLEQGKKLYRVAYHISSISSNNLFTIVYDSEPELVGGDDFADVPTATELTPDNYAVVGTEEEMQKIKMDSFLDFIRENGLFDLDGKGRPLLPGYGIATTKVLADFTNGSGETGKTYTELFGIENRNDITFIYGYTLNNEAIDSALIDSDTGEVVFVNRGNSNTKDVTVYAFCVYKLPVPYEPGLRSITKEFTISASNLNEGVVCTIHDFGVYNLQDIVSLSGYCKTVNYGVHYNILQDGVISWAYHSPLTFSNYTFSITLIIKDHSSIGPSIVTDGIRMITKKNVLFEFNTLGIVSDTRYPISFFQEGLNAEDIIGVVGNAIGDFLIDSSKKITMTKPWDVKGSISCESVSLIVKVPVVEEGPPIGEIISYMGTTAPNNFLICDGTAYNISDYPQLAEHFTNQFGSANHFGGDGTTTFAVPDLRGEFLRGSIDDNIGAHQDGTEIPGCSSSSGIWYFPDGNGSNNYGNITNYDKARYFGNTRRSIGGGATQNAGFIFYTVRPTNTAVLYCIRAKK